MAIAKRKRKGSTDIPTNSVSDIAFLLIIFFILTTSFRKIVGFTSEFPTSEKTTQEQKQTTPTIAMKKGTIVFNNKNVSLQELKEKLAALKLPGRKDEEKIVLLEASVEVSYQDYYDVMASVGAAGGIVALMTEDKGGKK